MGATPPAVTSIAVVGGGITGMAAAWRAATALPPASVVLVEAGPALGGKIVTERLDGCLIEGGPDCFLATKPAAVELCRDLGIADRLIPVREESRRSYVRHGRRLFPLPVGITGLIPSQLGPLLSSPLLPPLARVRAAVEPFVPRQHESQEESVAAFVRRRLGPHAYTRLVEPLLAGVFAGDGEQLSLDAAFPHLRQAEQRYGSLFRALRRQQRASRGRAAPPSAPAGFVAPRGGLGELVETLARQLPAVYVWTGARVGALRRDGSAGWRLEVEDGRSLRARCVILALPAFAAAALLQGDYPTLAHTLEEIPFVSTATVTVGYDRTSVPPLPRGSGYVVPRIEDSEVVACTWTSQKFPERAPDHLVLLRFFVGRAGREDLAAADDAAILQAVGREASEVLGIQVAPRFARVFRWPRAMPQYTLGHGLRLERIEHALASAPGLFLAGASYRGVGLPDCIASGLTTAARACAALAESPLS
jgi:oxygen-dependent protoporphyrinogen oxidase